MARPDLAPDLHVRRLTPDDDRSGVHSGNVDLDRFFIQYAGQNQFRHHIGSTYVAVDSRAFISGFATLTASEIASASAPTAKRTRPGRYPLPVLRLARLAVDTRARGRGTGERLGRFVFALAHRMAADVGCVGIAVDAKDDAVPFYERLGFVRLEVEAGALGDRREPRPLFIALGQIPRV